jgi:hypothetical protein
MGPTTLLALDTLRNTDPSTQRHIPANSQNFPFNGKQNLYQETPKHPDGTMENNRLLIPLCESTD